MRTNSGSIWRLAFGLVFCISLGGMRYWSSGGSDQGRLLAVCLTLFELSLVYLLEHKASAYKRDLLYYRRCLEERSRWDALVAATRITEERSGQAVSDIKNQMTVIFNHIKDRISRLGQIPRLRELALKTILDGYSAGVSEQEGRFKTPWKYADDNREED